MKLRFSMLLASCLVATLYYESAAGNLFAQAQPAGGSTSSAGQSTTPGILQTPSTGSGSSTSASRQLRSRENRSRPAAPGSPARKTNSPQPAQDANSSIQVIGYPSTKQSGTAERPLLPIASLGNALGIPSGTPIQVRLNATVDSGHARNGQMVDGALAASIGNLPVGTPVRLTVVQSAPAGTISSYGQLSLQVVSIADRRILSDTITALGKAGATELPDAAPARGTEAVFASDQPFTLPAA